MRAWAVTLVILAAASSVLSGPSKRQIDSSIQCAPTDDDGSPLTSSAPDGEFVTCTYKDAGPCTYFPADGSFSSGSSTCPKGLPQTPATSTTSSVSTTSTTAESTTSTVIQTSIIVTSTTATTSIFTPSSTTAVTPTDVTTTAITTKPTSTAPPTAGSSTSGGSSTFSSASTSSSSSATSSLPSNGASARPSAPFMLTLFLLGVGAFAFAL